jgi:hypothetical protein
MRHVVVLSAVVAVSTLTSAAIAADASGTARAETLFEKGAAALNAGDYATACPAFEESYKLSPALGTAYDLAICADHAGKKADALRRFRDVLKIASEAGRKKTEQDARAKIATLEPQVGHLRLLVPAGDHRQAMVDGKEVKPGDANDELVDPGDHDVQMIRDGRASFTSREHVGTGETREVAIPAEPAPVSKPEGPPSPAPDNGAATWRAIGIGAAVVGLVGVGIGTGFGLAASSNRDNAITLCSGIKQAGSCVVKSASDVDAARNAWSDAKSNATLSTIGFAAGGVLLVGGAILYFAAPSSTTVTTKTGLAIDPRGALRVTW